MSKTSGSKGRGRNRGGGKRPGRGGNFDGGGRSRGNAQQLMDKFLSLARDAASQGDRILAEHYFQHADHYYRVLNARGEAGGQNNRRNGPGPNGNYQDYSNDDDDDGNDDDQQDGQQDRQQDRQRDPIPVQRVQQNQPSGPVDLMGSNERPQNQHGANGANGGGQPAAASQAEAGGNDDQPKRERKPRAPRKPRVAKDDAAPASDGGQQNAESEPAAPPAG